MQIKKFKIYDKYIFKQVLFATLACIILFTIIWIAPETMLKVVRRTLNGTYTIPVGIQLLIYEVPKILNKALPIGLFLGTLFTFDKLSKDSEITIFRTAGMSSERIMAPVIVFSIFITIICFFVNNIVGPFSCNKLMELKEEEPYSNIVYIMKDEVERPKQIVIIPNYSKKSATEPIIMNFSNIHYADASELKEVIVGERGIIQEDGLIVYNGRKYTINHQGIFENVTKFENYSAIPADKAPILYKLAQFKLYRDRDLTNAQLVEYMKLLKKEELKDEYRANKNKLIQRYTHSLMCILFAIFGCYLGFSRPREQRLTGFIIAIAFTFFYYITLPPVDVAAEKGLLSPFLAAMFHPILLMIFIYFTKKAKDV